MPDELQPHHAPPTPDTIASLNAVFTSWLSATEAGRILGVSRARVSQLAERLGGVKIGRDWRFSPDRVATFERMPRGRPCDEPKPVTELAELAEPAADVVPDFVE